MTEIGSVGSKTICSTLYRPLQRFSLLKLFLSYDLKTFLDLSLYRTLVNFDTRILNIIKVGYYSNKTR